MPASLRKFGFTNIIMVKEQAVIDGNFPTVESPNPEERKTMSMAIDLAAREGADLVLATDPDSDRIGVALRNKKGEYVLLNGNQTLVLLMSYQLTRWAERGELDATRHIPKIMGHIHGHIRVGSFTVQHVFQLKILFQTVFCPVITP